MIRKNFHLHIHIALPRMDKYYFLRDVSGKKLNYRPDYKNEGWVLLSSVD